MSFNLKKPAFFNRPGTEEDGGFRLDLEGVRALAIILVLLAHAKVPGFEAGFIGIDVFFVLSGFLITGLLFSEFKKTGTVSLKNFYAKRARRLLPLATTVLVFIAIGSFILYSLSDQIQVGKEIIAAALYFVNWLFAFQGVDYFNQEFLSPVQHYWSLSVEEQFYLFWPGLIIIAGLITKFFKINKRLLLIIFLLIITLSSFLYGLYYSEVNQTAAYFSTLTRIWELGFGGLLFLILPKSLSLKPLVSNLLIVFGFILIALSLIFIQEETPYPSLITWLPVLATSLFIVSGSAINSAKMIYLFLSRPAQYLGRLSYSIYLWHWPFVVFALFIWPEITTLGLVSVTLISFIPAHLSHILIERPIHKGFKIKPSKGIALGVSFSLFAVLFGLALSFNRLQIDLAPENTFASVKKGIIGQKLQTKASSIRPDPLRARYDRGLIYQDGCIVKPPDVFSKECRYGNLKSDKKVVLFGDSHAMQWFGAIEPIAIRNNWQLVVFNRVNCPAAIIDFNKDCDQWRSNALKRIIKSKPKLVIISSSRKYKIKGESGLDSRPYFESGFLKTLSLFNKNKIKTLVIGDIALAPFDPSNCVAENINNLSRCYFKPELFKNNYDYTASNKTKTTYINPLPLLCGQICPSTVSNINIYSDRYHITDTFSKTLSYWFEDHFEDLKLKKAINS